MKTVGEVRRENLLRLAQQCGSQRALAEKIGRSTAQVNQWVKASIAPKTGKPRYISNDVAREIERTFSKPEGWLDQDPDAARTVQPDADILALAFRAVRQYETKNDLTLDIPQKAALVSALYVHIAGGAQEASEAIGKVISDIRARLSST